MKSKIIKLRTKLFEKSEYEKESIEQLKEVPTYKLYKPEKLTVKFEKTREHHDVGFSYVDDVKDTPYHIFLIGTNQEEVSELTPVEAFIRYNIEDPNLPHYPGDDYVLDIHDSQVVNSIKEIEKYNINKKDLRNYCDTDFPSLLVRGEISKV